MSRTPSSSPGDENSEVYSSTMHELIALINGGAIGLLQVTYQSQASIHSADLRATILSFCVFIMIYAVLRVYEVKLKRNQDPIHYFVGHISHLFGALAALMLVSVFSPIFTFIVAPLWLAWFFVVMYVFLAKLINYPGEAGPSSDDESVV